MICEKNHFQRSTLKNKRDFRFFRKTTKASRWIKDCFNELAGKPKNYPQYLLGSNIDWGQDAYALKAWVEKHPDATPLYISYSTPISLAKLGIESVGAVPTELTAGWMVIGVNELFRRDGKLDWLKEKEIKMICYSIWVIEVKESANHHH